MGYNAAALQQMRGQQLMDALYKAHEIFRRKNEYQLAVDEQYRRLADHSETKGTWTMIRALKHPAMWVKAASLILAAVNVVGYIRSGREDMFFPGMLLAFACIGFVIAYAAQAAFVDKKLGGRVKNGVGIGVLTSLAVTVVVCRVGGFGWCVVLYGLVGLYTALCWVDIKLIHKAQHGQKQKSHFRSQDEEMALELSWRLKRLQDFSNSDAMQFACAMVPEEFQGSQELGALLLVMKKYAVYDLRSGIQCYYQEQHMQRMEAEAAAQRRAQEQAAAEQRAQTAILERQRRDNEWHNKEMLYQQQRANEEFSRNQRQANDTLRDMYWEQRDHNREVERYFYE